MPIELVAFAEGHLDGAGVLLAARHREHRAHEPALPERFEDATQARAEVERVWREDALDGVVALRAGRLVGYLLGGPLTLPSTSYDTPFVRPGATDIPLVGHAVEAGGATLYQRLYATLAARWVTASLLAHYVAVPAHDRAALDAWSALGFGQALSSAVRGTDPVVLPTPTAAVDVRPATAADEATVVELGGELWRSYADPPILVPILPEALRALSERLCRFLADPASPIWLATRNGRVEAFQLFLTPEAPGWGIESLLVPDRGLYLHMAYTVADVRSRGINTALLGRTMAWANAAGYAHCVLHYLPASRAAGYWQALGFRPVEHWLFRQVDGRLALSEKATTSALSAP